MRRPLWPKNQGADADPGRPNEIFLYELYTDRAAFEAHLASDQFVAFDANVAVA